MMMMPKLLRLTKEIKVPSQVYFLAAVWVLGFLLVMWEMEVFKLVLVVVLVIGPDLDPQTPHQLLTVGHIGVMETVLLSIKYSS